MPGVFSECEIAAAPPTSASTSAGLDDARRKRDSSCPSCRARPHARSGPVTERRAVDAQRGSSSSASVRTDRCAPATTDWPGLRLVFTARHTAATTSVRLPSDDVRVLVTNDDGVEAPGLHALARRCTRAGHEVVVVAPSGDRSGSGAAIGRCTAPGRIAWTAGEWAELPDVPVHAVDVPPAAAVYAACLGGVRRAARRRRVGRQPRRQHRPPRAALGHGGRRADRRRAGRARPRREHRRGRDDTSGGTPPPRSRPAAVEWLGTAGGAARPQPQRAQPAARRRAGRARRRASARSTSSGSPTPTDAGELHLEYKGDEHEPAPDTDCALVHDGLRDRDALAGHRGGERRRRRRCRSPARDRCGSARWQRAGSGFS